MTCNLWSQGSQSFSFDCDRSLHWPCFFYSCVNSSLLSIYNSFPFSFPGLPSSSPSCFILTLLQSHAFSLSSFSMSLLKEMMASVQYVCFCMLFASSFFFFSSDSHSRRVNNFSFQREKREGAMKTGREEMEETTRPDSSLSQPTEVNNDFIITISFHHMNHDCCWHKHTLIKW